MKNYTKEELATVLEQHRLWLAGNGGKRADLSGADLSYADLRSADLRRADLSSANLSYASLSGANLHSANLRSADLSYASLSYADLRSANLRSADLRSAKNIPALPWTIIVPEGTLTVYKKTLEGVVTLQIPEHAKRSNGTSRKCRASEAIVIGMPLVLGTSKMVEVAHSLHDADFTYRLGDVVKPDSFDENRWNECAPGIHFFLTREEAEAY